MESARGNETPVTIEKEIISNDVHFRESWSDGKGENINNDNVTEITEDKQLQEYIPVKENENCKQSSGIPNADDKQINESLKSSIDIEKEARDTDQSVCESKTSLCGEVSFKEEEEPLNVHDSNNGGLINGKEVTESNAENCLIDAPEATEDIVLVPPDGGWGWVAGLGAFIIMTLLPTVGPCFGILFSGFLTDHGASSATTSWIFNIQMFMWHSAALLVNPLTQEFGYRKVGTVGILLTSFAIMLSAFSPSAGALFFTFSFISGVGNGLGITLCFIVVPQYFEKKRGLSNSLLMTGICVGQILGAPFARHLLEQYGFIGASLVSGAVILNGLVGVSFFHPVQWHMKKKKIKSVSKQETLSPLLEVNDKDSFNNKMTKEDNLPAREGTPSVSHGASNKMIENDNEGNSVKTKSHKGCFTLFFDIIVRVIKLIISDLKITRMHRALIIAGGSTLCVLGYLNFLMLVPFAMQSADHSLQDASWCISVFGISNMLTRFITSPLSDWKKFNMRYCMLAGYALASISIFVFPFLEDVTWIMAVMVVLGCGIGSTMALGTLVMIKYMGIENLAPTLGVASVLIALGCVTLGPFVGFIRDVSDSYAISMWILSGFLGGSFCLWLFMPAAVRRDAQLIIGEKKKKSLINNGRQV